ncbi:MAG: hypothetical protein KME47_03355 [Nodosilinea sp. WJT8-NPBG4]|nr:hypothetical protein [Nodosilinea sp. WJT8-NPBG4]
MASTDIYLVVSVAGTIARRTDEVGQLARVFDRMAQQVYSREQKLKQQVRDLRIKIDETKRQKQVQEIVETDFFQDLVAKAQVLRDRNSGKTVIAKAKSNEAETAKSGV